VKPAYYRLILFFNDKEKSVEELAKETGLAESTIKKYVLVLMHEGLVQRRGEKTFGLTDEGLRLKSFLRGIERQSSSPYVFTDPVTGSPIPLAFKNYIQLWAAVKYGLVDKKAAEEHFERGYLKEWIRNGLNDDYTYSLIENGKIKTLDDLLAHIENAMRILNRK
jgi:predicted transcriptional regulator